MDVAAFARRTAPHLHIFFMLAVCNMTTIYTVLSTYTACTQRTIFLNFFFSCVLYYPRVNSAKETKMRRQKNFFDTTYLGI